MPQLSGPLTPAEKVDTVITRLAALRTELEAKPLNARATVAADQAGVVDLHWDPIPGSTAYVVGRDGTDNRGGGPIAFTEGRETTSRTFIWLTPSTTTLFVLALPSGTCQAVPVLIPGG